MYRKCTRTQNFRKTLNNADKKNSLRGVFLLAERGESGLLWFDEVFDGLILIWMETDIGKVAEG